MYDLRNCRLCPRECGADRTVGVGSCGAGDKIRIARASPHMWEEPCISGTRGSGTVFFSGCSLGCVFCQNRRISAENYGAAVDEARFERICFELKERGVHNISLVSADHYIPLIIPVLRRIKEKLSLPVVFNCSGYESEGQLEMLSGIVDIYLPDLKFFSPEVSAKYASCPDYFKVASRALDIMVSQQPRPVIGDGIMRRGVIVRHLILPGCRKDSLEIIGYLKKRFSPDKILISLMSQYTPNGAEGAPSRRITSFEYSSVCRALEESGFSGYYQDRTSASSVYTPDFDLTGV